MPDPQLVTISRLSARNRDFHLRTVRSSHPSRCATAAVPMPLAEKAMILARRTLACPVLVRWASNSNPGRWSAGILTWRESLTSCHIVCDPGQTPGIRTEIRIERPGRGTSFSEIRDSLEEALRQHPEIEMAIPSLYLVLGDVEAATHHQKLRERLE